MHKLLSIVILVLVVFIFTHTCAEAFSGRVGRVSYLRWWAGGNGLILNARPRVICGDLSRAPLLAAAWEHVITRMPGVDFDSVEQVGGIILVTREGRVYDYDGNPNADNLATWIQAHIGEDGK